MKALMPKFPLYIPSKGRSDTRFTVIALQEMKVPFRVVIEEQEYSDYLSVISKKNLLVLDKEYQRKYDTCDNLGDSKSKGPGPARNFIWDHAISEGHAWHWTIDDNIKRFFRYNKNLKVPTNSPAFWTAMEDFCIRYENVSMAGPNYFMFVSRKAIHPPFVLNTRIYSCNLIRNNVPFRWRGRYNEDTILSLDMLKGGWCTVQFNAFLQEKLTTQTIKGGNTGEFYAKEGTLPKSKMQVNVHPDVSRIVWRFGRWHHYVDYKPFKKNKLIRSVDFKVPEGPNEYGMKLVKLSGPK